MLLFSIDKKTNSYTKHWFVAWQKFSHTKLKCIVCLQFFSAVIPLDRDTVFTVQCVDGLLFESIIIMLCSYTNVFWNLFPNPIYYLEGCVVHCVCSVLFCYTNLKTPGSCNTQKIRQQSCSLHMHLLLYTEIMA